MFFFCFVFYFVNQIKLTRMCATQKLLMCMPFVHMCVHACVVKQRVVTCQPQMVLAESGADSPPYTSSPHP